MIVSFSIWHSSLPFSTHLHCGPERNGLFVIVMGMRIGDRVVETGRKTTLKKRYHDEPGPFFHGRKGIVYIPGNTGFT